MLSSAGFPKSTQNASPAVIDRCISLTKREKKERKKIYANTLAQNNYVLFFFLISAYFWHITDFHLDLTYDPTETRE